MISLGRAADGRLVLGSNAPFPADVKYIEYYAEQRLFNLVYDGPGEENALLPTEIDEDTARTVRASPNIMVIAVAEKGRNPYGYTVPLIQVGI